MNAPFSHAELARTVRRTPLRRDPFVSTAERRRWIAALALSAAAALWLGWIGFIASDDSLYYQGALRWLTDPPFAGDNHWSTRFPLTLTFAGAIALLGQGYAAFAATALLFYAALVAVTGVAAARIGGERTGWIAALLTATLPVIVSHATTVSVDLVEAAALMLGAMWLGDASDDRGGEGKGLAAGVAFGVAMLCRETTALPLIGLAPLFLLGRPVPRRVLIAAGLGFALVIGAEALFQHALTGDALRRYTIAFHHDEHIDRAANLEGNLLLWPPIDPVLVLLVNDDFGLLFWIAGAALATGVLRRTDIEGRARLAILGAMALAAFLLVAVLTTKLVLNPRYFTLPALAAVIVVALWLDRSGWRVRVLTLGALVASGLLLASVGNAHPRWQLEALVAAAEAHPDEPVSGARDEVRRAALPIALAGRGRVTEAAPRPGGLVVAPEASSPAGEILARYPSPPTRLGQVLRAIGVERLVPAAIARRMFAPNPTYVLVRVGPKG